MIGTFLLSIIIDLNLAKVWQKTYQHKHTEIWLIDRLINKIDSIFREEFNEVFISKPLNIFTLGHGPDKNAKMFEKLVKSNKGSIRNSFDCAYQSLKNTFQGFSPGYVVFCERMARYTKKRKRKIDESGEVDDINENHQ